MNRPPKSLISKRHFILIALLIPGLTTLTVDPLRGQPAPLFLTPSISDITVDAHPDCWPAMEASLRSAISGYNGHAGIYVKNLRTGREIALNADERFITASLIKLPIMMATFQAIREGRLSKNSTLRLHSYNKRGGSGYLKWAKSGKRFPLSRVLFEMMTKSDNTAAAMMIERLGYQYLNARFRQYGLSVTRIKPSGMSLDDWVDPRIDNYTTPREMGTLLEQIYRAQVASRPACNTMISIMKQAEGRSRLAKYLPSSWSLARKGGLVRGNLHDVGIVFTDKDDYVICVMTGKNWDYDEAKTFIGELGKTTYTYLAS